MTVLAPVTSIVPNKGHNSLLTTVLIDNCVWDRLWERNVQLGHEQGNDLAFAVSRLGMLEIPLDNHPNEKARQVGLYALAQLAELDAQVVNWLRLLDLDATGESSSVLGDLQADGIIAGGGYLTSLEGQEYREANQHHIGGASGSKRQKSACCAIGLISTTANGHLDYQG